MSQNKVGIRAMCSLNAWLFFFILTIYVNERSSNRSRKRNQKRTTNTVSGTPSTVQILGTTTTDAVYLVAMNNVRPTTDDKDLFMESLPPDYKTKHVLPKTDFIRGGFKPYAWVRPIHPAFHFNIKESTQGWRTRVGNNFCETKISNVEYKSSLGERGLKIAYKNLSEDLTSEVYVETFFPEVILDLKGKKRDDFFHYDYISCPTIFPGQKVTLEIENIFSHEISITLFSKYWGENDKLQKISSNIFNLSGNEKKQISWDVPDTSSNPIGQIGFNIASKEKKDGEVVINYVNFEGEPKQIFKRPDHVENYQRGKEKKEGYYGEIWRNAWVQSLDKWEKRGKNFRICQNNGRGILFTGTDLWRNYSIASNIMLQSSNSGGIVSRVQGVNKYYTFEICKGNKLRIGKMNNDYKILKEEEFGVEFFKEYNLKMTVIKNKIIGHINDKVIIEVEDDDSPFLKGGAGLVVDNGTLVTEQIILN